MSSTLKHINNLLFADKIDCERNIRAINEQNLSEQAKNILTGYFRERRDLNDTILQENGFYNEQNINAQNTEEHAN
ncbi:hypothetical protein [Seonamhaeicola sp.]|uniref:hypothetical protein n=1 Tax=Seonamhaeicola sp. TaxID=1912245 RepID=UPI003568185A